MLIIELYYHNVQIENPVVLEEKFVFIKLTYLNYTF
jgi:hypothetical protein